MAELAPARIWMKRLLFVVLCLLLIFIALLPLRTLPSGWAGPDLILCLALAWSLRRPDLAPVTVIAGMMLLADFLFQRPPGLLPLLLVIGHEYLQRRAVGLREASFAGEWVAVAIVVVGMTLTNRLVLSITNVEQARLSLVAIQMVMTLAAYPIVAAVTELVFGIRKPEPSDSNAWGGAR